jgi:arylsulfatase A-like enzyme
MYRFPLLSSVLAAIVALCSLARIIPDAGAAYTRKPNIVVIVGDDMGYADLGVHGCRDIRTPHLDALAKSGVRCTNGYVSGPYCSPTRAALLTGRYQQRFGHEFNPGPAASAAEPGLPLWESTMADQLKAAGYATGLVGKWHLGYTEKQHPQSRGFTEFFGFLGGAHPYFPNARAGQRIFRGRTQVEEKEYLIDALAREAMAFINRHKAEPFFLYLAFNAVHTPMHASDKYYLRFPDIQDARRRTYAAMMSAMDDAVGRVSDTLREAGLDENTLVFFISDNGGPPVNASNNTPLRGRKAQTLEGGVRVPFFVRWKGKIPEGKTYDSSVIQIDVLPTALAAAGASPPAGVKLDGVNLLPHLSGEKKEPPHERLYWRFGQQMAIRDGSLKLVKWNQEPVQLYDLAKDISEEHDLAASRTEDVKRLQAAWDEWNRGNVKPLWEPPRAARRNRPRT